MSSKRTYRLCPRSIHPDTGKPYTIEKDLPIAEVTRDQATRALATFIRKAIERPQNLLKKSTATLEI